MPKYLVKTPIRKDADPKQDGATHLPGDTIELSAKEAAAMGADVVTPINGPKTASNGDGAAG